MTAQPPHQTPTLTKMPTRTIPASTTTPKARRPERPDPYPDLSTEQIIDRLMEAQTIMATALRAIVNNEGKVCEEFELCRHAACRSSHTSWQIADEALAKIKALATLPVEPPGNAPGETTHDDDQTA